MTTADSASKGPALGEAGSVKIQSVVMTDGDVSYKPYLVIGWKSISRGRRRIADQGLLSVGRHQENALIASAPGQERAEGHT
jgi:hypothetical protein